MTQPSSQAINVLSESISDHTREIQNITDNINSSTPIFPGLTTNGVVHSNNVGTLSTSLIVQTDVTNGYVDLTNAQTISGVKVFLDAVEVDNQVLGTNNFRAANTRFVQNAIDALVDNAPEALDTLKELAAALGDDENFATTVTASIGAKANSVNPTFTGTITTPLQTGIVHSTSNSDIGILSSSLIVQGDVTDGYVTSSSNQTINGIKTFDTFPIIPLTTLNTAGVVHANTSGILSTSLIVNNDITDTIITGAKMVDGTITSTKLALDISISTTGNIVTIDTGTITSGGLLTCSNSLDVTNGTIKTPFQTGIVHSNGAGLLSSSLIVQNDVTNGYVDLTNTQTISGVKTFTELPIIPLSTPTTAGIVHVSNNGTLSTSLIVNGDITDATIATAKIADNAITTAKILDNAITVAKILDGTINSAKLASDINISTTGSIVTGNTGSITSNGLLTASNGLSVSSGNVTIPLQTGIVHSSSTGLLSSSLIVNTDITDANITTAKIADDAITGAKLAPNIIINTTAAITNSGIINNSGSLTIGGELNTGTVTAYQPERGGSYKKVIIYFDNAVITAGGAIDVVFNQIFVKTPFITGGTTIMNIASVLKEGANFALQAEVTYTGYLILEGF